MDDRKNQLKMVKSCAVRLLDLVSNIMQMSNLNQGTHDFSSVAGADDKEKLRKDLIDLPVIISEVCTLVTNATDKAGHPLLNPLVKFDNKLSEGIKLPIMEGDAYKITQVFYNIVTNACKFCRHGSISVDAAVNDGRVEVSVTDTGVGINPENVKRIFGEFCLYACVYCGSSQVVALSSCHYFVDRQNHLNKKLTRRVEASVVLGSAWQYQSES